MKKLLFIIDTKTTAYFIDRYTIHSYIKYVFKCQKKDSANDLTKYNVYSYKHQGKTIMEFFRPDGHVKAAASFIKKFRHEYENFTQYQNILSYALFFYEIDDIIITNLYRADQDNHLTVAIPELLYDYFIKEYYSGNEATLNSEVRLFVNKRPVINYNECDIKFRRVIERDLFASTQTFEETILTVSHSDREVYSIYRLIKNIFAKRFKT